MNKNKKIIYNNFIQKNNFKNNKNIIYNCSQIIKKIIENLETTKDTFHSLSDKFEFNFKIKDLAKFKNFEKIAIIGMGGSILGAEAIYSFLIKKLKKKMFFFNDIDMDQLKEFKNRENLKKILFIVISKSGSTVETLSNFLALKIIKKGSKNIIIITEKKDSPLYLLSKKMKLFFIAHKRYISGRYSVLSEVGMVPAYLMGVNINNLRKNLTKHFDSKRKKFLKESSVKLSHLLKNKKYKNLIFFNYIPQLNKFLYWCQQLIAESLGKKNNGFLPVVSPAPKDHHSLLQLYLDGPKDKLFYIFSSMENDNIKINSKVLKNKIFSNNKTLSQIKLAQKDAFIKALKKQNIPFREFKIKELTEEVLGELFSYFILETAIIGRLANIDPFNQPAVEQVKVNIKKNLN